MNELGGAVMKVDVYTQMRLNDWQHNHDLKTTSMPSSPRELSWRRKYHKASKNNKMQITVLALELTSELDQRNQIRFGSQREIGRCLFMCCDNVLMYMQ